MSIFGIFSKEKKESLDKGLEKSKSTFFNRLGKAMVGKATVDEEVLDELEEVLIGSDVGVETTVKIIRAIEARVARDKYMSTAELDKILREEIAALLKATENNGPVGFELPALGTPYVMLVVGVNGVGKTTTIGKLSAQFAKNGKKVVLGAADTFRAAAVDQLKLWSERTGATFVSHGMHTDPASVAFDAVKEALAQQADVVLIDTAGRLHNKVNLMNELGKIKRITDRIIPGSPHEVLLVLDGSTGQNAFLQAQEFARVTEVTALAITKLDGTAKGGVVIGISDQLQIPVRYIGVGEKVDDLQVFDKYQFVDSFFKRK